MSDHTMKMPAVGDVLLVEYAQQGTRKRVEVMVSAARRFRFTVETIRATDRLPEYYRDWDIRTGTAWGYTGNYAPLIGDAEFWVSKDRRADAWKTIAARGIRSWDLRGDLKVAAEADPVRFAAVLEQFIISVNEEQK